MFVHNLDNAITEISLRISARKISKNLNKYKKWFYSFRSLTDGDSFVSLKLPEDKNNSDINYRILFFAELHFPTLCICQKPGNTMPG